MTAQITTANSKENRPMKLIALTLATLTLALTGCSSEEAAPDRFDRDSETPFTAPEPQGPTPAEIDEAYVSVLVEAAPELASVPAASLISVGHEICGAFDRGATFEQVATVAIENGFSPSTSGSLVGVAVGAYCPHHESIVNDAAGVNYDRA